MKAAVHPAIGARRLLVADRDGIREQSRSELGRLFRSGDLVVANDATTLPASLRGRHERTGDSIEVRLAGYVSGFDPHRFRAVVFGAGEHTTATERRRSPPLLMVGDGLALGPLTAIVESVEDPRLVVLGFSGDRARVMAGLARHGRPIQYAHVPTPLDLWDVWTNVAGRPFAFEAPSAGFALDWGVLTAWLRRGIGVATLTHAAGVSSTGDPELDRRLPLDEPYLIPERTAESVSGTKEAGGRVIAVGTTVVRALEAAAIAPGRVRAGEGMATGRIGESTRLQVVDVLVTGIHEPADSHFELLRAFADDDTLEQVHRIAVDRGFLTHEFGDTLVLESKKAS